MSSQLLITLMFVAIGVIFVLQGLPGLVSSELYIRGKYGRATRYTGNKAVAVGFGTVAFGLLIALNGLFFAFTTANIGTLPKSPMMMAGFIIGIGVYLLSWIVSWFVSGTAVRERTRSWWW